MLGADYAEWSTTGVVQGLLRDMNLSGSDLDQRDPDFDPDLIQIRQSSVA